MLRVAKYVAKGYQHLVTQRGNYRQVIFDVDEDFIQKLKWLQAYSRKYGLDIHAYCLFFGKTREVMVAYVMEEADAKLLTIHPLKEGQKKNREKSRRWRKL